MSLRIQRSEWFIGDLEHYAAWYCREANWRLAEEYLRAVTATVEQLGGMPGLGRLTSFPAPELRDLYCWPVQRPFQKHLIFYRHKSGVLSLERIVHGARDLLNRLSEPSTS